MQDAVINIERDIVIISDRQKGLTETASLVLANAHHSYCFWYLIHKLYRTRDKKVSRLFID